jgi:hypothetical protein
VSQAEASSAHDDFDEELEYLGQKAVSESSWAISKTIQAPALAALCVSLIVNIALAYLLCRPRQPDCVEGHQRRRFYCKSSGSNPFSIRYTHTRI